MSSVATTALRGRVVTPHEILDDGLVVVTDRHIAWVGRAQDARGAGFGRALEAVRTHQGEERESARLRLLELFEIIGATSPEVAQARRRLASLLY